MVCQSSAPAVDMGGDECIRPRSVFLHHFEDKIESARLDPCVYRDGSGLVCHQRGYPDRCGKRGQIIDCHVRPADI